MSKSATQKKSKRKRTAIERSSSGFHLSAIETEYERWLKVMRKLLGSGVTSSTQLQSAGKDLFGNTFKGVYAADKIPDLKTGETAIVNLDKTGEPGSHWVALTDNLVYDSFGRSKRKILPDAGLIQKNTDPDPEQTSNEEDCGARSMAFLVCYHLHGNNAVKHI